MNEFNVKDKYIIEINKNINYCIKNKAMLSFKYEYLNFWVNFTQITIIILSGILTLMDSIKSYYNIDDNIYEIVSIFFTFLIGLIMAIYRFFKMDDRKENICNLLGNYTFIINKFKKLINTMKNFVITENNIEEWNNIMSTYQNETIDNYISIQENFDNIFSYKDKIYYKDKFKKLYLQQEMIDNEIETIHFFKKNESMNKYIENDNNSSNIFCCFKKKLNNKSINYNLFINENEPKYIKMCNKHNIKKSNQDIYYDTFSNINNEINNDEDGVNYEDDGNYENGGNNLNKDNITDETSKYNVNSDDNENTNILINKKTTSKNTLI